MGKENFNRRDFLKTSFKTIAIGSLALSALDIKKLLAEGDKNKNSQITKVINLSDYPDLANVGGYAMVGGRNIVIRVGQSKFITLNTTCSHKKCEVDYDGSSFECPCHGSTYDKYGKVTGGPATKNLKSYKSTYNADDNTLTINM